MSWRCCGTSVCGEGWMQGSPYDPIAPSQTHDILWCQTDETQAYTCTMAQIISDECDVHEARASGEGLRFDDDARHRTLLHDVLVDEGYAP